MSTDVKAMVAELLAKARVAQEEFGKSNQEQLDKAAKIGCKTVYDNAEILAEEAVAETGMGTVEGKIGKMHTAMTGVWQYTKGRPSTGVIGWEKGKLDVDCMLKIAKPAGVIAGVAPSTNPTAAIGFFTTECLKGGNALILCPHPKAQNVSKHCVQMIRDNLTAAGFNPDIVQVVPEGSIEATTEVMRVCDLNIAVGGTGVVKAALSVGKPSFGVGQGNCQAVVDRGYSDRYEQMAADIVFNRQFDSGIPCTGEQAVIYPAEDKELITAAFEKAGAYIIYDQDQINALRDVIFPDGVRISRDIVGKAPQEIADKIGLKLPEGTQLIMLDLNKWGADEPLSREKLCVVTNLIAYEGDWKEAIEIAKANLLVEGTGHSADVYTDSEENQVYAGEQLPVGRMLVNQSNLGTFGVPFNEIGLIPTHGIGCGFWQGNMTGEHVNFEHLLNITRVCYNVKTSKMPALTPEEVWAD